jgi:uncharacterized protein (DUF1810 family)
MERFIIAQDSIYNDVVNELRNGRKVSHWMWYIFPQLAVLGRSEKAIYYGIKDIQEATEYCSNTLLLNRYLECCHILLNTQQTNPEEIFGPIDAIKLNSSLTLFYIVDKENRVLYERLIHKFYDGRMDPLTLDFFNAK